MGAIRIARPRTCKRFIHHGLTLGCLLRLTTIQAGKLTCKRVSGNSHTRRVVVRQIRRAIIATGSEAWLIAVHAKSGWCSISTGTFLKGKKYDRNSLMEESNEVSHCS